MSQTQKRTFEEVYVDHFSYVYNMIYMQILDRQTAEDLTSDTFIKAMEAYDRYDPALASERTWLCNIGRRLLIDHYRARARHKVDAVEDDVLNAIPDPDSNPESFVDDNNQAVYELLRKLDDEERHLMILRYFMNKKNPEIAEELGISPKAVSERYRRLLIKCRTLMQDSGLVEFG